mmetsp:Transcript_22003/g.38980  ORF Transcript_22003/g.38980 Transcript_22003/m.38980 type:complete len:267 (+) Transcript_22003:130-930(+)
MCNVGGRRKHGVQVSRDEGVEKEDQTVLGATVVHLFSAECAETPVACSDLDGLARQGRLSGGSGVEKWIRNRLQNAEDMSKDGEEKTVHGGLKLLLKCAHQLVQKLQRVQHRVEAFALLQKLHANPRCKFNCSITQNRDASMKHRKDTRTQLLVVCEDVHNGERHGQTLFHKVADSSARRKSLDERSESSHTFACPVPSDETLSWVFHPRLHILHDFFELSQYWPHDQLQLPCRHICGFRVLGVEHNHVARSFDQVVDVLQRVLWL